VTSYLFSALKSMWNPHQSNAKTTYVTTSWLAPPPQHYYAAAPKVAVYHHVQPQPASSSHPHPPQPPSAQKHVAVGASIGTILNKLSPWDQYGYVKRILSAPTEEDAVMVFSDILDEDDFVTLLSKGRQALSASDQALLIKFFAQIADKYPRYNLYASVTSIIAELG